MQTELTTRSYTNMFSVSNEIYTIIFVGF
jgi:hypothetical protein